MTGNLKKCHKHKPPLVLFTLLLALFLLPQTVIAAWYDNNWGYRKQIDISAAMTPSTQTDFPVLISISADANLSANALANGDDILFTSSDGSTKLSHEIESYNNGTLVAWVKVPSLSGSVATSIYLYYGNSGASNQESITTTWDSNFAAVWHMNEDPVSNQSQCGSSNPSGVTDDVSDATGNAPGHTCRMSASNQQAAKIAGGLLFQGPRGGGQSDDDIIDIDRPASLNNFVSYTLSSWIYPTDLTATGLGYQKGTIYDKGNNGLFHYGGNLYFTQGFSTTTGKWRASNVLTVNTWHHVVVAYTNSNTSNTPTIYVNGNTVSVTTDTAPVGSVTSINYVDGSLGARLYDEGPFLGNLDEIKISSAIRSADWIQTEYNNQSSPATYQTVGAQTTRPTIFYVGTMANQSDGGDCSNVSNTDCSLNDAVAAAAFEGDTVQIDSAGTYLGAITLSGHNITLKATVSGVILSGSGGDAPVFNITGSAITSSTVVDNVTINNNSSGASARAISITTGAAPTLKNLIIKGNTLPLSVDGAAIYINGATATIQDSIIGDSTLKNQADEGAGIYATGLTATLTLSNTTFLDNYVDYRGGAIRLTASPSFGISMTGGSFDSNDSIGPGGAIYADASGGMTFNGTNFTANTAAQGGNAIYADNNPVTLIGGAVSNNTGNGANSDGTLHLRNPSTTFTASGTTFTANSGRNGGIIYATGNTGNITLTNTPFTNNNGTRYGGAINISNAASSNTTTLTITGASSILDNNDAGSNIGGAIYTKWANVILNGIEIKNSSSSQHGGAIYFDGAASHTLNIDNSNIHTNAAGSGSGGAIYVNGATVVQIDGTIINNNTAGGGGGAIYMTTASSTLAMNKSFIQGNSSQNLGGGGIYINAGTATITNSVISGNRQHTTTWRHGGGIYVKSGGTLNLYSSVVAGNYTRQYGGGIYAGGTETIRNSIVYGNTSTSGYNVSNIDQATNIETNSNTNGAIDPLFVDLQLASSAAATTTGDYRLCITAGNPGAACSSTPSPAIDTGGATNAPVDDILGNSRPIDITGLGDGISDYDMGAYENTVPPAPSISGSIYDSVGGAKITTSTLVRLVINGNSVGTDTTTTGDFSIVATGLTAGDKVLIYLDDATPNGTTITVSNGGSLAGLDIYQDHVTVRNDNGGTTTNTDLKNARYDADSALDLLYQYSTTTTDNINTYSNNTILYIPASHSYSPGGDLLARNLISAGTFDGGSFAIETEFALTISGGTFTAPTTPLIIGDDFTISAGSFVHNNGTVRIGNGGNHRTINTGSAIFNDVEIAMTAGGQLEITGTFDVNGNLTITGADEINTGIIAVAGNVTTTDNMPDGDDGNADILFDGNTDQILSVSNGSGGTGTIPTLNVAKTGGTLFIKDTIIVNDDITYTSGTVDATASTVHFGMGSSSIGTLSDTSGSIAFNNFVINRGNHLYIDGVLNIDGDLTITTAANIYTNSSGAITLAGNLSITDTVITGHDSVSLIFDGGNTQTISLGVGADIPEGDFIVNKSGGSLSLLSDIDLDRSTNAGQDFTIVEGTFDLDGKNITLSGGGTLTVEDGGNLQLMGSESPPIPTLNIGSTVTYDGIAGPYTLKNWSHHHLVINGPGATFNMVANETLSGNLTISSGIFDATNFNYSLNVAGNWSNSSTFIPRAGTVILDGDNQSIIGSSTFNNLTKIESSNNATDTTLTFDNLGTQTINGTLTLDGLDSDDRINLVSDNPGAQWNLTLGATATKTIDFVDVRDSDASGSDILLKPINPSSAIDSGNNTDWFGVAISGTAYIDWGTTPVPDGTLIRLLINGASAGTATTTNGIYSITVAEITAGTPLLVFMDTNGGNTGTTATVANGNTLTGLDIYKDQLILRHDNAGTITNTNLGTALGAYVDSDIAYTETANNITVTAPNILLQNGHSYTPGGDLNVAQDIFCQGTFIGGSGSITIGDDLTIKSSCNFTATSGTTQLNNDFTIESGSVFSHNSGLFLLEDPSALGGLITGSVSLNNVTIAPGNSSERTWNVADGTTVTINGKLSLDNSTIPRTYLLSPGTATFDVKGDIDLGGEEFNGNINIKMSGGATTQTITALTGNGFIPNLEINKSSGTVLLSGTINVHGDWTHSSGNLDASTNATTINFDDTYTSPGNITITSGGATAFYNVTFDHGYPGDRQWNIASGTTLIVANNLTLDNTTQNTTTFINGPGKIVAQKDVTIGTDKFIGTALLELGGSNAQLFTSQGTRFELDLNINKTSGTVTLGANLTMGATGQNLTIAAGTLDASTSNYNITLAGNWSNSGTFTARLGTVTLSGTSQALTGSTTFNNFTKEVTNAATLTIENDSIQTINGNLSLSGAGGQLLSLRSSGIGAYTFDVSAGEQTVSYLDVQYANASSNDIIAYNSTNSGNNDDAISPRWVFSNGLLVTNLLDDNNPGSLRYAMNNAISGNTINFHTAIFPSNSPATIPVTSALPSLVAGNVTIDASNVGVIVDGTSAGAADGITISSNNNLIKGLRIQNFSDDGIYISSGTGNTIGGNNLTGTGPSGEGNIIVNNSGDGIEIISASNNVYGNFIGSDGSVSLGNSINGININGGASNTIGGINNGQENVISGNNNGISITAVGATNNTIQGNLIGTNAAGTVDLGNTLNGIIIFGSASNNTVGGTATGAGNLISGNNQIGVRIKDVGSDNNVVLGNLIGTDINGTSSITNTSGVFLQGGASNNTIGGTTAAEINIISGNNVGIKVNGATTTNNTISGNYIGTDINGTAALVNAWYGIQLLNSATTTTIGGTTTGAGNVISGNSGTIAVRIQGNSNTVLGNYIGVDKTGGIALANGTGVEITGTATGNTIGGTAANSANIIASNITDGIRQSSSGSNNVYGNYIGTNSSSAFLPNGEDSIEITAGTINLGHASESQNNVIAPNTGLGINLSVGTINLAGTIDINDDVTLTSGILNMGSANLNLSGHWNNSGTIINANTSTLTIDGTNPQTITSNGASFNNLTVTNSTNVVTFADAFTTTNFTATTANSQLSFTGAQTYTINGTLNLNGQSSGTKIVLRSTTASQYTFDVTAGEQTVKFVDVQYSAASSNNINAIDSSDSGNNDNGDASPPRWVFLATVNISGTVYSSSGSSNAGAGKTVRLIVNGTDGGYTGVTNTAGLYSITAPLAANDAMLVYVDGDSSYTGTTVTVSNGATLSLLHIYNRHLLTRHDNGGTLTNALMNKAKEAQTDADILYTISSNNLIVSGTNTELYLPAGHSYSPGGAITTAGFESVGTFNGGSAAIDISLNLVVSGGSFTNSSAGMTIERNFTHSGGTYANSGSITFDDDWETADNSTITCNGTLGGTIDFNKNSNADVIIAAGCTINLGAAPNTHVNSSVTNNGTLLISSGTWTETGNGLYTNNGTITHNGNGWDSSGGLNNTPGKTITYSGTSLSFERDFTQNGVFDLTGKTIMFNDDWSNADDSTITCSGALGGTVDFSKNNNADIVVAAGCSINLGASPTTKVDSSVTNNGTISIASGTWTETGLGLYTNNGTISHNGNGWDSSGSLNNAPGKTITYNGTNLSFERNFTQNGIFDLTGKTITFDDDLQSADDTNLICGSILEGSIVLNKADALATLNIGSNCTIKGHFTRTNGVIQNPLSNYTLSVEGDIVIDTSDATGGSNLNLELSGSNNQNISLNAGNLDSQFSINKSGNTATLLSAFSTTNICDVVSGTFDTNGNAFTCGSTFTVQNGAELELFGSESITSPVLNSGSTVTYTGNSDTLADTYTITNLANSFHHLNINAGDITDTFQLGTTLDVNGNFTHSAGTFDVTAGNYQINVAGNWNNSGTFTARNGTVVLDGTGQSISGSNTFNNLTKTVSSADTLTITAGTTQTINGTITLNGASGQLLTLASSTGSSAWNLNLASTANKAIDYVSVSWSDASGSHASQKPVAPTNSTDGNNNTDWFVIPTPVISATKISSVISDPFSASNPKRVPGAVIQYIVTVTNSGTGSPDNDSVFVDLEIGTIGEEYDYTSGIIFTEGSPSSSLILGTASYSDDSGSTWSYSPSAGYDPNVTDIKIPMNGTFAAGGAKFTIKYYTRIK